MLGGRGMGGGNILRTVTVGGGVARASVASGGALQEPFSAASRPSSPTSRAAPHQHAAAGSLGLSSPFSAHSQTPVSAAGGASQLCEEFEWVGDEKASGVLEDWAVPSSDEVHSAVSALRRVFGPISYSHLPKDDESGDIDVSGRVLKPVGSVHHASSFGPDADWIEPSLELQLGNPRVSQARGVERVYDAFHLLETDPSIQRMVRSVSSDRAVWDAILNNEAVQHLRNSFSQAGYATPKTEEDSDDEPSDDSTNVVQWIFNSTKTKVVEVIERMTELVKHLLHSGNNGEEKTAAGGPDGFEEKLRTSFFISIVVLMVVVVSRAYKASE